MSKDKCKWKGKEIKFKVRRIAPNLLLMTVYLKGQEIGFSPIPDHVWEDREELKSIAGAMLKMRAYSIPLAILDSAKGGSHVQN